MTYSRRHALSAPPPRAPANALFSTPSALVLVGYGEAVSRWIGDVAPAVLRLIGVGLLLFAAVLFWEAGARPCTQRVPWQRRSPISGG